tara:strand:+ start:1193 stop:1621 length:429 start_codon:yes stop_codon:yes gene_type:complete
MKSIVLDTGYWIALFNPEKNSKKQDIVKVVSELIDENNYNILIPFPTLYEFLNTKLSRNKTKIDFDVEFSKSKYQKIPDTLYRDKALKNFSNLFSFGHSDVSLVDEVIKEMIDDIGLPIDYIVTFDEALKNFAIANNVEAIE